MTDPAIVLGNQRRAVATFIEDERGDLVDIEYECLTCAEWDNNVLWLPGYGWPDYSVVCKCGSVINKVESEGEGEDNDY